MNNEDMAINIIIDNRDPDYPFFVGIENDKGEWIIIGEELQIDGRFQKIRISALSIITNDKT
jgi:hypothetical protein